MYLIQMAEDRVRWLGLVYTANMWHE